MPEGSTVITSLGTIITALMGYVGDVIDTIVGNQLLLIPFAIFVVGAAIGLFSRLFGAR